MAKAKAERDRLKKFLREYISSTDSMEAFNASLKNESDRAVIILVASVADILLKETLKERMKNKSSDLKSRLFDPDRPLGSFTACIDLSYAMGWITNYDHSSLIIIRDMRNACAHSIKPISFETREIADLAKVLKSNVIDSNQDFFGKLFDHLPDETRSSSRDLFIFCSLILELRLIFNAAMEEGLFLEQLEKALKSLPQTLKKQSQKAHPLKDDKA